MEPQLFCCYLYASFLCSQRDLLQGFPPSCLPNSCSQCCILSDDEVLKVFFWNRWLGECWGMCQQKAGDVPNPAVTECFGFQLACLSPALCPEWRQQDFPTSTLNIWSLRLPGEPRGGRRGGEGKPSQLQLSFHLLNNVTH